MVLGAFFPDDKFQCTFVGAVQYIDGNPTDPEDRNDKISDNDVNTVVVVTVAVFVPLVSVAVIILVVRYLKGGLMGKARVVPVSGTVQATDVVEAVEMGDVVT